MKTVDHGLFLFRLNDNIAPPSPPFFQVTGGKPRGSAGAPGTWLLLVPPHVEKHPGGGGLIGVGCFVRGLRLKPRCASPASCEATTAAWVKICNHQPHPCRRRRPPRSTPPSSRFDGSLLMRNKLNDLHPARPCRQPFMQSRRGLPDTPPLAEGEDTCRGGRVSGAVVSQRADGMAGGTEEPIDQSATCRPPVLPLNPFSLFDAHRFFFFWPL